MIHKAKYTGPAVKATLILIALLLLPAKNAHPRPADFDFFSSEEVLDLSLRFNFKQFLKTRKEPEYIDAILTLDLHDGKSVSQKVQIKARGDVRRTISQFPPIKLKFCNDSLAPALIQRKGTLKLVTPCNHSTLYQNYVFKEYLAYRMLNLVTPYSFKTRMIHIRYIDSKHPKRVLRQYGFIIENEKDLARRNGCVIDESRPIPMTRVEPLELGRLAVFNYLIGNTDWAIPSQHNIIVLKARGSKSGKVIPVAYDFDYSGFVHAEYSVPGSHVPIEAVTERHYMGIPCPEKELQPVLDEFIALRSKLIRTINDFELLPKMDKKDAVHYLNGFFKTGDQYAILLSDLVDRNGL